MKRNQFLLLGTFSLALLASVGCASHTYYPPAPPPPPPPVAQLPPLIQLADRNGFDTGRSDGARDAASGYPFQPRRTRAYAETPGYDANLGPYGPYRNAFRNEYLRGYNIGFYRR
jgi:hypothetical protein